MELITIIALLYVSSVAFYHAGPKRSAFAAVQKSAAVQNALRVFGWIGVGIALALIVARRGFEVGIPLWIGAWVVAAVASLFLQAIWKRAHLPSAAVSVAIFAAGIALIPWGGQP